MDNEITSDAGAVTTDTSTPLQVETTSLLDGVDTETGAETRAKTEGETEVETEGEAEGEAKTEGEKEKEKAEPEGAPEEYAEFEVPEGAALDQELLAEFKDQFKAENLSQTQAQERVNQGLALAAKWQAKALDMHKATVEDWKNQTRTDPTIGGDKLPQVLAGAKQVRDQFGDEGLTQVLNTFGLGSHPSVIRFFSNVRAALSDDVFVKTGKPTGTPGRAADVLFGGTMNKKEG
jgi:hypothetical protein